MDLRTLIRDVPDFPKSGIIFKDITTMLKDGPAFAEAIDQLCAPYQGASIDMIACIESRGFIFGAAMAVKLGTGFIPIRKPGKLPSAVESESYALEYGAGTIEIHRDAFEPGCRVLLVDDLLATGGTAGAAVRLIERIGGTVIGAAFLISLDFLQGRETLKNIPVHVLINYDGE